MTEVHLEAEVMSREIFEFDAPTRFIVGTVGMPGERQFFIQAQQGSRVASFALEKSQAAALGERARELLKEIGQLQGEQISDSQPLEIPIESEFTVGVMSLTWVPEGGRVIFEAQALTDVTGEQVYEELIMGEDEGAPPLLRVELNLAMLRAFAQRTGQVVAAGRAPCIFCGGPINPGGHLCPRANGHRRSE